jgi:hypothetical protein
MAKKNQKPKKKKKQKQNRETYSTSLATKEMKIKTMLRFHLILVTMSFIKTTNNKF